jgi:hypothetical protein
MRDLSTPIPGTRRLDRLGFEQAKRISVMATCHVIGVLQRMKLRLVDWHEESR